MKCEANNEFRIALEFFNELRDCSNSSTHIRAKLPTLTLYVPTSNPTVTQIMKDKYVAFWQEMGKYDFRRYMKRLVELSKGAALPFCFGLEYFENENGFAELQYLKPLFKGKLIRPYLDCIKSKDGDTWMCLKRAIKKNMNDEVEKEMSLCALHLLDIVMGISERGKFDIRANQEVALRSDEHALDCIRKWDRRVTVPQILFRTFLLHARKLIAHLTGDQEQSECITRMQMQLERLTFQAR